MDFFSWNRARSQNMVSAQAQKCASDGAAIVDYVMLTAIFSELCQSPRSPRTLVFWERTLMKQH